MKKTIEDPATLAREIVSSGIVFATLASPTDKSPDAENIFDKIRIRPVNLKSGMMYQLEQFKATKVFHRNVDEKTLEGLLAKWIPSYFTRAEFTLRANSIQILANKRGEITALRKTAAAADADRPVSAALAVGTPLASASHNRAKKYLLEEGIPVPFLVDLGVMASDGTIVKSKYDKFRQINRFLEFIADVVPELTNGPTDGAATEKELTIVDFGCGKSYLTFAVYYYLFVLLKIPVKIVGLDLKEDVIEHCSGLALKYGYDKISFAVGNIADYKGLDRADMVITLHACDTATDFALAQAVRWNARVILSVPCCQHELNAQLADNTVRSEGRALLAPVFKYGIVRERMAALLTDALRAELLETHGYSAQILEFIDMSHTPKNLLIRAIRDRPTSDRTAKHGKQAADYQRLRDFVVVRPTLESELSSKR